MYHRFLLFLWIMAVLVITVMLVADNHARVHSMEREIIQLRDTAIKR